jgi:hypothetical protein
MYIELLELLNSISHDYHTTSPQILRKEPQLMKVQDWEFSNSFSQIPYLLNLKKFFTGVLISYE